jgi:hypothetical protein
MKYSIVTLGAAICAFAFGCQNQSVNDPVATDADAIHGAVAKAAPQEQDPSLITFDQKVVYTDSDEAQVMQAVGAIRFRIEQLPIMSDELYDVQISAKGALYPGNGDGAAWSFGGSSTDRIRILNGTKGVRFEKKFAVYGADVPTSVTMEFTVTEKTLSLDRISLSRSKKGPVPVSQDDIH